MSHLLLMHNTLSHFLYASQPGKRWLPFPHLWSQWFHQNGPALSSCWSPALCAHPELGRSSLWWTCLCFDLCKWQKRNDQLRIAKTERERGKGRERERERKDLKISFNWSALVCWTKSKLPNILFQLLGTLVYCWFRITMDSRTL